MRGVSVPVRPSVTSPASAIAISPPTDAPMRIVSNAHDDPPHAFHSGIDSANMRSDDGVADAYVAYAWLNTFDERYAGQSNCATSTWPRTAIWPARTSAAGSSLVNVL